jgi:acetyltransferase-like isoleucine patch superfamily enzyme
VKRILHALRSFRERNWTAQWVLNRSCRRRFAFACFGPFQITIARDALVEPPSRNVYLGVRTLGEASRKAESTVLWVREGGKLVLDGAHVGRGCVLVVQPEARLSIGRDTYVADGSRISASKAIDIGESCSISWNVTIIDDDGHGFGAPPYHSPVQIEDGVWIGCNVTILKGVTIGAGSAVAAGSVVTRSCKAGSLTGGAPARIIREGVSWTDASRF